MAATGTPPRSPIVTPLGLKRLALTSVIGTIVATAYAFLAPKWYTAQLTVVPPTTSKAVGLSGAATAAVAAMDAPLDLLGGASDIERIAAVFRSQSVSDAVITKFELITRYGSKYIEDARKELWQHCGTKTEKKPGLVTLSCEDRSPEIAKAMVEFFGEYGNQVLRRVSNSSAGEERRFLERRVQQAREEMDEASRRLRDFQEKNGIVSLPDQAKAIVESIASLRAELLSKQMQLSYVGDFASRDEAATGQLRRQIGVLEAKLRGLERSGSAPASSREVSPASAGRKEAQLFPPAMAVPKLQYELEQLFREQKLQETLFTLLMQRYEMARIQEARDTSTFQVLDRPTLPTKKTRPRRAVFVLLGLLGGLGLGWVWLLAPQWRAQLRDPRLAGGRR